MRSWRYIPPKNSGIESVPAELEKSLKPQAKIVEIDKNRIEKSHQNIEKPIWNACKKRHVFWARQPATIEYI